MVKTQTLLDFMILPPIILPSGYVFFSRSFACFADSPLAWVLAFRGRGL